jgi:class 3 adenylate cyclase
VKATFEDIKSNGIDKFLPQQLRKKLEKNTGGTDLVELSTHLVSLRKRMSAYIPDYLSSMISEQPVPGKSSITINHGSLVFADVSGFTSMSEKLSALGKEGAEEITLIVNKYFERMIAISQEFSGDLIKFGGDALILFYTGENASLRGLQSAVAMQEAMDEFKEVKTSQGVSRLKMSIGIATGLVYMIGMGTEEKMDYLAAGSTLERMDKAESISQAEQIVIDTETFNHVRNKCVFSEVESGYWLLNQIKNGLTETASEPRGKGDETDYAVNDLKDLVTEIKILKAVKPYIPSALFDHLVLDPHGDAYQGGHRPVTVLFAHFYGIDELVNKIGKEKPEVILEVIETYYYNMAQVIGQFGGTISRVDSYKSGHRILALFGALRAHEDDHQRAVQTAWEMNKRLAETNSAIQEIIPTEPDMNVTIGHRIGINTGFVFASDVGASSRREYTVMGDQVNLTARLMSAAEPGEILIGETTANRLESNIILEEKPPIMVKGKSQQVKRFALVDIQQEDRTFSESTNPLVGRDVELSLGKESVDKADHGIFSGLVIRGDSGIGKTRLSQEVISYAGQRNLSVISSHSQSFSKSMPYSTWIRVFNRIFGIETGKSSRGADLVRNALKEIDSEVWAPLFGSIIGADIPESRMTRILEGKVRKQKIFDLTIKLLAYQAEKNPFVLFLDDLQWADPVSLELFLHVISHMPPKPLLLLGAHRTDKGMPDWSEFSSVLDIELTELPDYATIRIAKQAVGGIRLPEPVLAYILEKTSGNPLFIQETMRALQAERLLSGDDSASGEISETLENLELPDTIHGLVISRIDRLPIESRYLLQLASISGVYFSLSFLVGAFNLGQIDLVTKTRLDHLVEIGVLEVLDIDAFAYRFQHLTTRDVVYDTLPYKERRKMHNQSGLYIESNQDFRQVNGQKVFLPMRAPSMRFIECWKLSLPGRTGNNTSWNAAQSRNP